MPSTSDLVAEQRRLGPLLGATDNRGAGRDRSTRSWLCDVLNDLLVKARPAGTGITHAETGPRRRRQSMVELTAYRTGVIGWLPGGIASESGAVWVGR